MNIALKSISQKFNSSYLFKNLSLNFHKNYKYAITGQNGSGKSTLIKIIASLISPTSGQVKYSLNNNEISKENSVKYINMLAPYLEPDSNLSLSEQLNLYHVFRPLYKDIGLEKILKLINLYKYKDYTINKLSSGMKQRLKLSLAFCFDAKLILLDEPTSYLDTNGIDLYNYFIANYTDKRLLIIASNQKHEISCCNQFIDL